MTIKSKVFKQLVKVQAKNKNSVLPSFKRVDIQKAIWIAQSKPINEFKYRNGYYSVAIQKWLSEGLMARIIKGEYSLTENGKKYAKNPKIMRELNKKRREKIEKRERLNKIEREREEKYIQRGIKKFSKLLLGKTICNVRYLSPSECGDMGWNKSPLVIEFNDKTCIVPQMDDEGNDGGALLYNDYKSQEQDTIYTI